MIKIHKHLAGIGKIVGFNLNIVLLTPETYTLISHGTEGELLLYDPKTGIKIGSMNPKQVRVWLYENNYNDEARIKFYACNAGTGGQKSLAYGVHKQFGYGVETWGPTHKISASWKTGPRGISAQWDTPINWQVNK